MAIQGLRTTTNFAADERPKNYRDGILMLDPNGTAPLAALTAQMKSEGTDDPEFKWWDKERSTRRLQLAADIDAVQSSVTVNSSVVSALELKAGDVVEVEETGEHMQVASDPSSATGLTMIRGHAGTTAAAVDFDAAGVNPHLKVIGSAYEEGSLAPTAVGRTPVKRTNYTQIFRQTIEITGTAEATRTRTEDGYKQAKAEAMRFIADDMEMGFFFGKGSEGTKNGKPFRTTNGVISYIASENDFTADTSTGVDFDWLEETMKTIFLYGSQEKVAFTGYTALQIFQQTIRRSGIAEYSIGETTREYGMNVSRIMTPFGVLVMKAHPLFNTMPGGTTDSVDYYGMDSSMVILDMQHIKYRYMQGRDLKFEKDLQQPGMDGRKDGWLAECGLEVHHPRAHGIIRNFAVAKAAA